MIDARLDDGDQVRAVDLLDASERVRREHDSAGHGDRAAGAPRSPGPRRDRDLAGLGDLEHRGHVGGRRRDHHRIGRSSRDVAVVARVRGAGVGRGEHLRGAQTALELDLRAVDGRATGDSNGGRLEEHASQRSAGSPLTATPSGPAGRG